MRAQEIEKGFIGWLGPRDGAGPGFEESSCTAVGEDWMLRVKSHDDCGLGQWEEGLVLISGQGFYDSENSGDKITAESVSQRYRQQGEAVAGCFDGSFVAVVWDAPQQRLSLWCDSAGSRLLYYYQAPDHSVWFASSLQLLMRHLDRRPISKLALAEYLRFLDISPPYTIYQDVFFLAPEKLAQVKPGMQLQLTDKPSPGVIQFEKFSDFDSVVTAFDRRLKKFITNQIESAPRLSSFLSGGIDSSLVTAVAASLRPDVRAVTVGFADPRLDESPVARKITGHLGIAHEVMCFSQEEDLQAFEAFTSMVGSPFADPAIIPTFQCFEKTARTSDLVLDGTGADTLIGMMPARHLRFILNYSARLPRNARRIIAGTLNFTGRTRPYKDLFDFDDPIELMIRWKGWTKNEISELFGRPCDLSHTMFYQLFKDGFGNQTPYELYSSLMGNLPDDRIHQSRAMFGPEVTFPFFDHEIRSFVRSLPMEYRYSPGEPKKLFRHLLGRYIPQEIWDVPKHGFDYPFDKLMRYQDDYLIRKYLSPESMAGHGLFDVAMATDYIQRFLAGDRKLRFKVWALLVFQAWYENFYQQQGGDSAI